MNLTDTTDEGHTLESRVEKESFIQKLQQLFTWLIIKQWMIKLAWINLWTILGTLGVFGICLGVFHFNRATEFDYSNVTFPYQLNPRQSLVPFNSSFPLDYTVLLDGHIHTTISDGSLTPKQVAQWAIASGYNAIFVTDHNTIDGATAVQKEVDNDPNMRGKLIALPGMEFTCCTIHMNILNINQTIPPCGGTDDTKTCPFLSDDDLKRIIDQVHSLGGWAVVNHIPWSTQQDGPRNSSLLPNHPTLQRLIELGIDAVEVVNQDTFDLPSYQLALQSGIGMMTGSDMHKPGRPYAWTVLKPSNYTSEAIWQEIKAKRTSFLFDPSGLRFYMPPESTPKVSSKYLAISSLLAVNDFFFTFYSLIGGMYSFQGVSCQPDIFIFHGLAFGMFLVYLELFIIGFTMIHDCLLFFFWKIKVKI